MLREPNLRSILSGLLIVLASILCFLPAVTPELSGDDFVHVYKNRQPFPAAFRVFTEADGREYRPLVRLSLALDHRLWGKNYRGFHATNLLLHLVVVLAVLGLARKLVPGELPPLFAAALFAVHPVHSYSVSGIMGRTDLLCALFLAGAALAFFRTSTVGTVSLFLLALLCKEVALPFPLFLLALLGFGDHCLRRKRLSTFVATALAAALYLAVRATFLAPAGTDLAVYFQFSVSSLLRNIAFYGGALLVPAGQFEFRALVESNPAVGLAMAALAVVLAASAAWAIRRQLASAAGFWLALAWTITFLLPVLFLFQRRYLYIPSIGFCIALGWLAGRPRPRVVPVTAAMAVAGCAVITLSASWAWQDSARLVGRNLDLLVPAIRERGSEQVYVANVPNGLGEAHLFTHDSLRFAIALRAGFMPGVVSLTRIQLSPGATWETAAEGRSLRTRITPGPASYFVFDAPEFLPRGGRFLPVGRTFVNGPFRIEVTATDSEGRVSELTVRWDSLSAGSVLLAIEPDATGLEVVEAPALSG